MALLTLIKQVFAKCPCWKESVQATRRIHQAAEHLRGGDYMIPVGRDGILSRFARIPAML